MSLPFLPGPQLFLTTVIDGFQMPIKCSTSRGQPCDQEATIQWTFHLVGSNLFCLLALMVRTKCVTNYCCILCIAALNTDFDSCSPKWSHASWKPSILICTRKLLCSRTRLVYTVCQTLPFSCRSASAFLNSGRGKPLQAAKNGPLDQFCLPNLVLLGPLLARGDNFCHPKSPEGSLLGRTNFAWQSIARFRGHFQTIFKKLMYLWC